MRVGPAQLTRDRNRSSGSCRNLPASPQLSRVAAELSQCTPPPVLSLTPTLQASVNWPNSTQSSVAECTRPSVQRSDSGSSVMSGLQRADSNDSVFLHSDVETPQRKLANKVNSETYAVSSGVLPGAEAGDDERCLTTRSRSTKTANGAEQEEDTPNLFLDDYLLQNSYAARNLRSLRDGSYSESPGGSSSGEKSSSLDTSHSDLQIRKKINVSLDDYSSSKCGDNSVGDILKTASDAVLSLENALGAKAEALCESKELQRRDVTDGSFGAGILPLSMSEFYDQSNPSFWSPVSSGGQKRLFDSVDRSDGHSFHAGGATGLTQEILHVSIGDEHRVKRGNFQSQSCRDESLDLGRHVVAMHDMGEVSMPSTNYELEQVESGVRLSETTPRHSGQSKFKPLCTSSWGSPKDTAMPASLSTSDGSSKGSDLPQTDNVAEDIVCVCSDTPEPAATKVSSHDEHGAAASAACCHGSAIQPDSEMDYAAGTNIDWLRRRRRVPFTDVCVDGLAHYSTRMADRTSDAMSPRWVNANIEASGVSDGQQAAASTDASHTCETVTHETDSSGQSNEVVSGRRCLTAAAIDTTDAQSGYRADDSSEPSSMSMEFPTGEPAPVPETVLSKYMAWEKLLPPTDHSEQNHATETKKTKCVTHFMSLPSNHSNDHGQSDYFTPMPNRRQRSRAFMVSSPRVKVSRW